MGTLLRCLVLAVVLGTAAGCGSKDSATPQAPVYLVSGTVMMKGQPLNEARVMASPAGVDFNSTTLHYDAITNEKGEFRFGAGTRQSDDLPPGKYDVRIRWPEVIDTNEPDREYDQLKGRYSGRSPAFRIEVKPEKNALPPFDLK